MDDTLTMTFFLAGGKTADGDRAAIPFGGSLWRNVQQIRFEPNLEDMGVGFLLDDPAVVAIDVAWVDDYDDTHEPVLTVTGLYYVDEGHRNHAVEHSPTDVHSRRVDVPYYESGIQISEWIVNYMQHNVYNQDVDADNNPDSMISRE